jgi:quercetin dioxygenase-like cupin family protein
MVPRATRAPRFALALAVGLAGCGGGAPSLPKRLTPAELDAEQRVGPGAGTSGVAGIRTTVLSGNPEVAGLYTIRLEVPANTRIEAHDHPDDRNATVASGTWYFGYGARFDEQALKALAPGSFYTEPPNEMHFARTGEVPVVLTITGYGPTGTRYAKH